MACAARDIQICGAGVHHSMRLTALHHNLLFTALAALAALLLLSVVGWVRGGGAGQAQRALTGIVSLLLASEALLGVALLIGGARPLRPEIHAIYGALAALTLPAVALALRDAPPRSYHGGTALACVFLIAIALRALQTG